MTAPGIGAVRAAGPGAPGDDGRPPRGRRATRCAAEAVTAFALYAAATGFYLRPIWRLWRDHVAPDPADPLFNLHVLTWTMRQLRLGLPDLWQGNWFYPFPRSLVLSDHLLGLAAQGLAVEALTGDAVAAYNALFFLAFPLSGLTAAAVLRAAGLGRLPALVGGAVYAFAPFHWSHLSHLQVLTYQWVPVVLWSFDRLLATRRARWAAAFLAAYLLQVTGGNYLAYMVHVPLLVLLVNRAAGPPGWRALAAGRSLRMLVPTGVLAAALTAWMFLPYWEASRHLDLGWGTENYRQFGATLPALLTPAWISPYHGPLTAALDAVIPGELETTERALFPGFVATVLAVAGATALGRWRPGPEAGRRAPRAAVLLAAAALTAFLAADLYTLGVWPRWLPPVLQRPGAVYRLLGAVVLAASVAALLLHRRVTGTWPGARIRGWTAWERGLLASGAVTLLLSYPVLFEPLAEVLPGLGGMRVPTRFHAFTLLAVAHLAARGTALLQQRPRGAAARGLIGLGLLAALSLESTPRPFRWIPVPRPADFPSAHHRLAGRRDVRAILELPLLSLGDEGIYMRYSTLHWHPLVNGASGHYPRAYQELREECCWPVPDERVLARLRRWGVSHVVVHPSRLDTRWARRAVRLWARAVEEGRVPGVRDVWEGPDGDVVFTLVSSADTLWRPAGPPPRRSAAEGPG